MSVTERQSEILRLRSMGYTQREVAELLGTTRENIAILEHRAIEAAERALETLKRYLKSIASFSETIQPGESAEEASKRLLDRGNKAGVRLRTPQPQLAETLRALGAGREKIERPIELFVLRDGSIVAIPGDMKSLKPRPPPKARRHRRKAESRSRALADEMTDTALNPRL